VTKSQAVKMNEPEPALLLLIWKKTERLLLINKIDALYFQQADLLQLQLLRRQKQS
jgi:hypothetical protein